MLRMTWGASTRLRNIYNWTSFFIGDKMEIAIVWLEIEEISTEGHIEHPKPPHISWVNDWNLG